MLYGYIRVSTGTQALRGYSLEEQKRALMNAGVEEKRIFTDAGKSGVNFQREGWINLTKAVREGDTIVSNFVSIWLLIRFINMIIEYL